MRFFKTFLFVIFLSQLSAQEMPFEDGIWTYIFLAYDDDIQDYNTFCNEFYSIGDTVLNGKSYFILYNSYGTQRGFFREENSKVYYVPDPMSGYEWNENLEEFVVFDYTLEVGDMAKIYAFYLFGSEYWELEVTSINMVEIAGTMRKEIDFGWAPNDFEYTGCQFRWIEGVGETQRIPFYFWPSEYDCITNEAQLTFSCLEVNGEFLSGSCNCIDSTPTKEEFAQKISIFPNPSTNIFQISNSENLQFEIEISNSQGKFLKTISENEIDLSNFPTGFYYANFKIGEDYFIEKLIKI